MQQPGQGHIGWTLAELSAQSFIGFQLRARGLNIFLEIFLRASTDCGWFQRPGQQPARERTPGDQADAIGFASWNHF